MRPRPVRARHLALLTLAALGSTIHAQGRVDYYALAEAAGARQGLPPKLMSALVTAESSGNPLARSEDGAIGLTQLMPGTARELGVNPHDPAQNVQGGALYLARQLRAFGNLRLALAAYNAGPGHVRRCACVPAFPETQNYVTRVLNLYAAYTGQLPLPDRPAQGAPVTATSPLAPLDERHLASVRTLTVLPPTLDHVDTPAGEAPPAPAADRPAAPVTPAAPPAAAPGGRLNFTPAVSPAPASLQLTGAP